MVNLGKVIECGHRECKISLQKGMSEEPCSVVDKIASSTPSTYRDENQLSDSDSENEICQQRASFR